MSQPHIDIWHSYLIFHISLFKFYIYCLHWYSTSFIFLLQILHFTILRFISLHFTLTFYILHWQFTFYTDMLHFILTFYILHWFVFHICNIHFTFHTLHFTVYILHSISYILYFILYILYFKFYILHLLLIFDSWHLTLTPQHNPVLISLMDSAVIL